MKVKKLTFALFTLLLPGCFLFFSPLAGTTVSASNTQEISPLTAGSIDELLQIVQDPDRTNSYVEITADLTIDNYTDLQQKSTNLSLELGHHSITVKNGGWLVLYTKELKGTGTDAPLIKVETGGSLVLGANTNNSLGINGMKLTAEGSGGLGGTAVELEAGAYFSTVNHPAISAYGNGARAVFHASSKPFSLPPGLTLYAQGNNAAALETGGDADIFYSSIRADGTDAVAVRIPNGASASSDSAVVSPMPANMTVSSSTFVDFNDDMDTPMTLWRGKASGLYLTNVPMLAAVARGGDMSRLEAIWINCRWDAAAVDFTQTGTYTARGSFSPLFPVTVTGLPVEKDVAVCVKNGNEKPDISTVHPLMPYSIGDGEVSYGFYIICNASYTRDIAQLWCSKDNGKNWVSADTMFQVFAPDTFRIPSNQTIYVTGLKPEKSYLFRLESTGRDTMDGEFAMAGISDVRQVIIQKSGKVANIDWNGDRDGGDTEGNPPSDVVQPAPFPSTPGMTDNSDNNTSTNKNAAAPAGNSLPHARANEAESAVASASESNEANTGKEKFGSTYSVITGLRLRLMIEDNKAAVFSKQGVTVTIPAQTIASLGVKDDDMFTIRIERDGNHEFSFRILVNGTSVKKLDNTTVRLPYTTSGKSIELTLKDEAGNQLTDGHFDTTSKIATFIVDAPGHFTIQENSSFVASSPDGQTDRRDGLTLTLAALGVAVLIAACCMLFFYKRRHSR